MIVWEGDRWKLLENVWSSVPPVHFCSTGSPHHNPSVTARLLPVRPCRPSSQLPVLNRKFKITFTISNRDAVHTHTRSAPWVRSHARYWPHWPVRVTWPQVRLQSHSWSGGLVASSWLTQASDQLDYLHVNALSSIPTLWRTIRATCERNLDYF